MQDSQSPEDLTSSSKKRKTQDEPEAITMTVYSTLERSSLTSSLEWLPDVPLIGKPPLTSFIQKRTPSEEDLKQRVDALLAGSVSFTSR
jgi:hypothetical protein